MEEVIIRVGLPVKCRLCDARHNVKPGTDYDGWAKLKTVVRTSWYCPEHAGAATRLQTPVFFGSIASEPKAEVTPADALTELMSLI